MRMNSLVLPAEILIVLKDMDQRLLELEGTNNNDERVEETPPARRRTSKVSKKKVSPS